MIALFQKIRHTYLYDLRLRYKLLISHVLPIFLPTIVFSFILYTQLYGIIVSDSILSEQALTSQTVTAVENTLSRVTQASDTLAQSEISTWLFTGIRSASESSEITSQIRLLDRLCESLTDGDLITDVQFYIGDESRVLTQGAYAPVISPLSGITGTYWYGIFSSSGAKELFCPSLYLSATEENVRGSLAYIRRLETRTGPEAYLAIYFSSEQLSSILRANVRTDNAATYILNERDAIVSSSSPSLSGAYYMDNRTLLGLVEGVNQYSTRSWQEDNLYVGYYEIAGTDWHLVSVLSATSLIHAGNAVVFKFVGVYALFFILAIAVAVLLSNSFSKRIATLSRQMQSLHHERPIRISPVPDARDEIGGLLDTYNEMSDEINELMDQQARSAEALRIQEFRALQAQINPHFLYNSLDMISWMAKANRPAEVVKAVQALSKFYKLTLSKKESTGSIANEIQHVSLYIELQNMRFENRIFFDVSVPEPLLAYSLPKLCLQPIIENSILHGIMEKPEKAGSIIITGWMEGSDVLLLVSDDGVGMRPEQLTTILSGEGEHHGSGTSIGVYNTHARLKLLYGPQYGLTYASVPGQGTDVQIRVPARTAASVPENPPNG